MLKIRELSILIIIMVVSVLAEGQANALSITTLYITDNANNGQRLMTLSPGMTLDLSKLPSKNINVEATVASDHGVLKVIFQLDSNYSHTEANPPFAMCGDWTQCPANTITALGSHKIAVIPYDRNNAVGPTYSLSFNVVANSNSSSPLKISSSSLVFGNQAVNSLSTAAIFNFTNSSSGIVRYSSSFNNADFTFGGAGNCPTNIPAGLTCTMSVKFSPVAAGTRTGVLTIVPSAPYSPLTVSLSGTGTSSSLPNPTPAPAPKPTPPIVGANNYYVSPSGKDGNSGTSPSSPWLTIGHAASTVAFGSGGAVVHFAAGTYNFTSLVETKRSGSSSARLVYQSDVPQAAHFVWNCGMDSCFIQSGDYVDIIGFDISGPTTGGMALGYDFGKSTIAACNANGVNTPDNCGYASHNRFLKNVTHDVGTARVNPVYGAILNVSAGGHDSLIDGNVFKHNGIPNSLIGYGIYLAGYHHTVTNNVLVDNTIGIHLYHNPCENVVANNTLVHNRVGGILIAGWATNTIGIPYCPSRSGDDYNSVTNNIVVRSGSECGAAGHGAFGIRLVNTAGNGGAASHNKVSNNYSADNFNVSCGIDNSIQVENAAAPALSKNVDGGSAYLNIFANYQDNGSGDYHLKAGSPAINAGAVSSSTVCAASPGNSSCVPTLDFSGSSRSTSPSLGAYEYH